MPVFSELADSFSAVGREAFARGEALVAAGILPQHIMWDADEVLWDWLMFMGDLSRRLPRMVLARVMTHREYILPKPGILELAAGMAHAASQQREDPRMRIWTDGYPWRLWRIAQDVPLLAPLVGISENVPEAYERADNIFCRLDYVKAVTTLVSANVFREWRNAIADGPRAVIDKHFATNVADSTLKLPELAEPAQKGAFAEARFLIDNTLRNVERFVASGRRGVHVTTHAPRLMFIVPNTVWRGAPARMRRNVTSDAAAIADALLALVGAPPKTMRTMTGGRPPTDEVSAPFMVEIPSACINAEWLEPRRTLKQTLQANASSLRAQ